ncbi:MAG: ATP-dependent zinc metalloprotease FtsH [Firmicutes bacterium]|nr:ATP-dependent zinc metalloprotease FtsH [Bacillota bacterium]
MNRNNNIYRTIALYFIVFMVIFGVRAVYKAMTTEKAPNIAEYTYSDMLRDADKEKLESISVQRSSEVNDVGTATVKTKEGMEYKVQIASVSQFLEEISESAKDGKLSIRTVAPKANSDSIISLVSIVVTIVIAIMLFSFIFQQMNGGGGKMMNFGKSRAKLLNDDGKRVTFDNVAGLVEEKAEVAELVDFLRAPKKYVDIGARIPKGVLMVGSPGTGKTLLAKAIAGEANVPFFSISGSDFVEMFVGVGASRVRDLFEQAKRNSPCLVFIDEIDAVGRRRGAGLGGGHDEREQTLNQLLVEMDGFGANEGVIVIAATNRPDILDPALLRPGRFDRRVVVGIPDVKGRKEILEVHAKGKKIAADVDMEDVAKTTPGFTGADLENLLNESALLAARQNKKAIEDADIRQAFIKVAMGTEKKSKVITDKEKKLTAYHEAGHAILYEVLSELNPVHMVSIISVGFSSGGAAGGFTMPVPQEPSYRYKKAMEQEIAAAFGGRIAESLVCGDISSGASGDIQQATNLARLMVTKYGMSEKLGPILFGDDQQEVFLGRDFGHTKNYSEEVAKIIDEEIKRIVDEAYDLAKKTLEENIDSLHKAAELLMEKEKITGEELREIIRGKAEL